jgi:hypothetical protein
MCGINSLSKYEQFGLIHSYPELEILNEDVKLKCLLESLDISGGIINENSFSPLLKHCNELNA